MSKDSGSFTKSLPSTSSRASKKAKMRTASPSPLASSGTLSSCIPGATTSLRSASGTSRISTATQNRARSAGKSTSNSKTSTKTTQNATVQDSGALHLNVSHGEMNSSDSPEQLEEPPNDSKKSTESAQDFRSDEGGRSESTKYPQSSHDLESTKSPQSSHDSESTKSPQSTHDSENIKSQQSTHDSLITKYPHSNHDQESTEYPQSTHDSESSKDPQSIHDSESTKHPQSTHDLGSTKHPQSTHDSESTKHPQSIHDLGSTKHPQSTHDSESSKHPQSTHESESTKPPQSIHDLGSTKHPQSIHDSESSKHPQSTHDSGSTKYPQSTHGLESPSKTKTSAKEIVHESSKSPKHTEETLDIPKLLDNIVVTALSEEEISEPTVVKATKSAKFQDSNNVGESAQGKITDSTKVPVSTDKKESNKSFKTLYSSKCETIPSLESSLHAAKSARSYQTDAITLATNSHSIITSHTIEGSISSSRTAGQNVKDEMIGDQDLHTTTEISQQTSNSLSPIKTEVKNVQTSSASSTAHDAVAVQPVSIEAPEEDIFVFESSTSSLLRDKKEKGS